MSDKEISAVSEVLDIVDDSEVKSESADDWPPVSIKQEPDLDAAATDSSSALNVASLVTFLLFLFIYAFISIYTRLSVTQSHHWGNKRAETLQPVCVYSESTSPKDGHRHLAHY